jgi:hypothetical protein
MELTPVSRDLPLHVAKIQSICNAYYAGTIGNVIITIARHYLKCLETMD